MSSLGKILALAAIATVSAGSIALGDTIKPVFVSAVSDGGNFDYTYNIVLDSNSAAVGPGQLAFDGTGHSVTTATGDGMMANIPGVVSNYNYVADVAGLTASFTAPTFSINVTSSVTIQGPVTLGVLTFTDTLPSDGAIAWAQNDHTGDLFPEVGTLGFAKGPGNPSGSSAPQPAAVFGGFGLMAGLGMVALMKRRRAVKLV